MSYESLKSLDRSCIFRETFKSEADVRANGGVPSSNLLFSNSKLYTSGSNNPGGTPGTYLYYKNKIFVKRSYTIRIRFNLHTFVDACYIFGGFTGYLGTKYFDFYTVSTPTNGYQTVRYSFYGSVSGLNQNVFTIPSDEKFHDIVITYDSISGISYNYVDGSLVSSVTAGVIYSNNITTIVFGANRFANGLNCTKCDFDIFEVYNKSLTANEVKMLYEKNLYTPIEPKIVDTTPNCFEGNNSAYIEVPDSDLLSFGDGAGNDQPFWISGWFLVNKSDDYANFGKDSFATGREYGLDIRANDFFFRIFENNTSITREKNIKTYGAGLYHIIGTYNGDKNNIVMKMYVNKVEQGTPTMGTYNGMANSTFPVRVSSVALPTKSGALMFDLRIGSGTLTSQQIQDIYMGRRVGTERLWLPLCENAGNVRFDVTGNGLHGILKGNQDGKYNVGKQSKFDYIRNYGSINVTSYNNTTSFPQQKFSFWYIGSHNNKFIIDSSYWSFGFRFIGNSQTANYSEFFTGIYNPAGNMVASSFDPSTLSFTFNSALTQKLGLRLYNTDIAFDGTGNTVNTPSTLVNDSKYHDVFYYSDGTNTHMVLDGSYKGYISTPSTKLRLQGFRLLDGIPYSGTFYDLRTWNNVVTQSEALNFHNDTMSIQPEHRYTLCGDNPNKDIVSTLDLSLGSIYPRIVAIPLEASSGNPPLIGLVNPNTNNRIIVNRNFKEVFRLDARKGVIADKYGASLTINGNVSVKQYGKIKGIKFGGTSSDYINCGNILNNELKDGFIIKLWFNPIVMPPTSLVERGILGKSSGRLVGDGFEFMQQAGIVNRVLQTYNGINPAIFLDNQLKQQNSLIIFSVQKEKSSSYGFVRNSLVLSSTNTGQYFNQNITNNLTIGWQLGIALGYNGIIFDFSISTAGILSLDEATQIYNSEKNYYGL